MPDPGGPSILVIGYGNTLRRDDGIGWRAAEEIEGWNHPSIRVLTRTQLLPEMVDEMACADLVLFIDARADPRDPDVRLEAIEPSTAGSNSLIHAMTPQSLMRLCGAIHGHAPPSRMVSIPVEDLGFGDEVSPRARRGLEEALGIVRDWVDRILAGEPEPSSECPRDGQPARPATPSSRGDFA